MELVLALVLLLQRAVQARVLETVGGDRRQLHQNRFVLFRKVALHLVGRLDQADVLALAIDQGHREPAAHRRMLARVGAEAVPHRVRQQFVLGKPDRLVGAADLGVDAAAVGPGGISPVAGVFVRQRHRVDGLRPVAVFGQGYHGLVHLEDAAHFQHQGLGDVLGRQRRVQGARGIRHLRQQRGLAPLAFQALRQFRLGQDDVVDIRVRADPLAHRAVLVEDGDALHGGPAVGAVGAPQAIFGFEHAARGHAFEPDAPGLFAVVRVQGLEPAELPPFVVALAGEGAPGRRVLDHAAVGGIGPDDLGGGHHERAETLLAHPQRVFRVDAPGNILVHQHDFDDAAFGILDRMRTRGDPARAAGVAHAGGIVEDGRNLDRFAGNRPAQEGRHALLFQLRIEQDVIAVEDEAMQLAAFVDLPQVFPHFVDAQGASIRRQDLNAGRGLLEQGLETQLRIGVRGRHVQYLVSSGQSGMMSHIGTPCMGIRFPGQRKPPRMVDLQKSLFDPLQALTLCHPTPCYLPPLPA
jgi:hypothetical protein